MSNRNSVISYFKYVPIRPGICQKEANRFGVNDGPWRPNSSEFFAVFARVGTPAITKIDVLIATGNLLPWTVNLIIHVPGRARSQTPLVIQKPVTDRSQQSVGTRNDAAKLVIVFFACVVVAIYKPILKLLVVCKGSQKIMLGGRRAFAVIVGQAIGHWTFKPKHNIVTFAFLPAAT